MWEFPSECFITNRMAKSAHLFLVLSCSRYKFDCRVIGGRHVTHNISDGIFKVRIKFCIISISFITITRWIFDRRRWLFWFNFNQRFIIITFLYNLFVKKSNKKYFKFHSIVSWLNYSFDFFVNSSQKKKKMSLFSHLYKKGISNGHFLGRSMIIK